MKATNMEVLITGASGNLGRRITEAIQDNDSITTIDIMPPGDTLKTQFHLVDIVKDTGRLEEIIQNVRPDIIIHLAALVGGICEEMPETARQLNTDATIHLADLARKYAIGHFIFTSSAAVYRQTTLAPTSEDQNIDPVNVYGKSKYEAEKGISKIALNSKGTQFTTLRVFNAYGHGFRKSLVERLRTSDNRSIVDLFAWNNFYRDYIHADDIVKAVCAAMKYQPEIAEHTIINIASGRATSNSELVTEMKQAGTYPVYTRTGDDDLPDYSWADISLAKDLLDFHPNTTLNLSS